MVHSAERRQRPFRPWLVAVGSAGLVVGAVCLGDELRNRQFLQTLPRDRRATLAKNLDRFDDLPAAEQAAIRRLDKTIDEIEPVEQARFRSLLHHYHLWFQGLNDDQQASLLAIPDLDERFRAARKLRLAQAGGPGRDGPRVARIRTGDYGMIGPYETAFFLKVWRELPPEKKAEFEKKPPGRLRDDLRAQAKAARIRFEPFPADLEKAYDAKLEQDDEFKPLIEPMIRRVEQATRKGEPQQKKADSAQKKFEHPFAEFLYFEENRPRPVDPARLARFAESCPDWFRSMTDSLAADDARDYYTIVYRLLYPTGEMPEPAKAAKPAAEAAPRKGPRAKADAPGPAF